MPLFRDCLVTVPLSSNMAAAWLQLRAAMRDPFYFEISGHHQNDFGIKTGSDVSHFNVCLVVQSHETVFILKRKVSRKES